MILPRHWQTTTPAGADCCGQACVIGEVEGTRQMLLCLRCGAICPMCGKGKRCVLPIGHEALPDFRNHESLTGSQVPSRDLP